MNLKDQNYAQFALVREMMDTVETIKKFDPDCTKQIAEQVKQVKNIYFTGEGSSRIFPAKNSLRKFKRWGMDVNIQTDGSWQSREYDLSKYAVFLASNSGRTKEVTLLAKKLMEEGNNLRFGLTANDNTVLSTFCNSTHVLGCGWEQAVAATKSVVEQALYYESLLWNLRGADMKAALADLPEKIEQALTIEIPSEIVKWVEESNTVYFAGYNDGVAEELTLKTNEITRRKSDFLEGTYVLHGIEEVMHKNDIIFMIDPIEGEYEKFQEYLVDGAGVRIVAIADHDTPFPTIKTPSAGDMNPYLFLCAGWNLLVEIGIKTGMDLDHPNRARKVGNEFIK